MGIQNPATSSDPYVRTNIYALQAVDMAGDGNRELQNAIDSRIGAALCRRGLLWEQPKRCYHLTAAGGWCLASSTPTGLTGASAPGDRTSTGPPLSMSPVQTTAKARTER